ncbi:hypothetical protein QNH46_02680 [Paenibacillus woosongensis]|uniref:Uncharacterized protein n=1 Tax=Paenibacillus woosongensis TaxID=307580 RepID=A0AA95I524_9BACL|nr:hypothetical protein [Paenibacillus woosongensis]WHX49611.1 hypothetical protein QNH46_02680 [Paenibacillus woosongensis]
MNEGDLVPYLLVFDYKSPMFKRIDEYLKNTNPIDLNIVFISSPWLFKLKEKSWKYNKIYFVNSAELKTNGLVKMYYRSEKGAIVSRNVIDIM